MSLSQRTSSGREPFTELHRAAGLPEQRGRGGSAAPAALSPCRRHSYLPPRLGFESVQGADTRKLGPANPAPHISMRLFAARQSLLSRGAAGTRASVLVRLGDLLL